MTTQPAVDEAVFLPILSDLDGLAQILDLAVDKTAQGVRASEELFPNAPPIGVPVEALFYVTDRLQRLAKSLHVAIYGEPK